ncbi:MAG: hypothetical protein ACHQNV_04605 [Vicinamibacteria bacterium]
MNLRNISIVIAIEMVLEILLGRRGSPVSIHEPRHGESEQQGERHGDCNATDQMPRSLR